MLARYSRCYFTNHTHTLQEKPKPVAAVPKPVEKAQEKVDESKEDHGMSKAEDKDMYTTRTS